MFFFPWFLIARSLSLPLIMWPTQGWVQLRANRSRYVCTGDVRGGWEGKRAKQIDVRGISEYIHVYADIGVM